MPMSLTRRLARAAGNAHAARGGPFLEGLEPRQMLDAVPADNRTIVYFGTTFGAVYIELFDDDAPITVANFLRYVNTEAYDGTIFHRMIREADGGIDIFQGGSFYFENGDTQPPPVPTEAAIVLEETGHDNVAGTIAMARTSDPNSATSGFFFNLFDNPGLDEEGNNYAVFGQVVKGIEVLQTMFNLGRTNLGGAFTNIPVTDHFTPDATVITEEDLVYVLDAEVVNRAAFRTEPGTAVSGAVNESDQLIISTIGAGGASQMFTPHPTDIWRNVNLSTTTGAPPVTGNLVSFFDTKTDLPHAVGTSEAGLILFTGSEGNIWSFRNLTLEAGGAEIEGNVTVFTSTDGFVNVAGMTSDNHLVLYRQVGTAENFTWQFRDLTAQDLEVRGVLTPVFAGELTSYVTAWNGLNIVGLDSDGDIQVIWWSPGIDQDLWTTSNLSDITGAPTLTGGLTVYLTSWQATNIVGITEDGNVSITWWLPTFGGHWNKDDLTFQTGGPDLVASTITSYVTGWGATNVAGLDEDGKLWVYWWTPAFGDGGWQYNDLISALPAGTKPMVGQITGVTSTGATINLVGSAENGDVMRFSWNASDQLGWLADDVSYLASIS